METEKTNSTNLPWYVMDLGFLIERSTKSAFIASDVHEAIRIRDILNESCSDKAILDYLETQIVQGQFYRGVEEGDRTWRYSIVPHHKKRFKTFREAVLYAMEHKNN